MPGSFSKAISGDSLTRLAPRTPPYPTPLPPCPNTPAPAPLPLHPRHYTPAPTLPPRLDEDLIRARGHVPVDGEAGGESVPQGGGHVQGRSAEAAALGAEQHPVGEWRRPADAIRKIGEEGEEDVGDGAASEHVSDGADDDAEENGLRLDVPHGGAYTVTLGNHSTQARYYVDSQQGGEAVLEALVRCGSAEAAQNDRFAGPHGLPRRLGAPEGAKRSRVQSRARGKQKSTVIAPPATEYLPNALDQEALAEIEGKLANCFTPAFLLDFDGTLTPIIRDPAAVRLSPEVSSLLQRLADRHPTAIVSGRAVEKLQSWAPVRGLYYAGSHGFEIVGPNKSTLNYTVASTLLPELRLVGSSPPPHPEPKTPPPPRAQDPPLTPHSPPPHTHTFPIPPTGAPCGLRASLGYPRRINGGQ